MQGAKKKRNPGGEAQGSGILCCNVRTMFGRAFVCVRRGEMPGESRGFPGRPHIVRNRFIGRGRFRLVADDQHCCVVGSSSVAVARSGAGRLTGSSTGRSRGSAAAGSRSTAGHLAVTASLLEPAEHRTLLLGLAALRHRSTAGRRSRSTAGRSGRSGTGRLTGSSTARIAGSSTARVTRSSTARIARSGTARGRSAAVGVAAMTEQAGVGSAGTGCDHQSGGQSRPLHLEGLLDVT